MEHCIERTELERDKENNARLNNLPLKRKIQNSNPISQNSNASEESLSKHRIPVEITPKRIKLDNSKEAQKSLTSEEMAASGHKSSSTNKPKTPTNYSGNRRFDNSSRPRLGVHYLDDDSDDGMPNHLGGDLWKQKEKDSSSKNSSNQRTSLPDITSQPSTSGEHYPTRSKDQRNFENKKRALFMKKSPNNASARNGSFSSDIEECSISAANHQIPTAKNQTKNGKKSSVTTRNHSFNGALNGQRGDNNDSRSEGETSYPTFSRHFRSPVNKRSSRNLPEMSEASVNGETSDSYSLARDDRFFPRARLPIDGKFRGRGSPPRCQNPPHHRRQANGRNDTPPSFIRNLVRSIPDVFDTEEEASVEVARNSPLRRSQTRAARQVDNREVEEGESRLRFPRTRQTLQGFSPDHQPRRRTSRASRQNRLRYPGISFDPPAPQTEAPATEAVETVRQIQDDEEFARLLQAEFDAEADNNVVFHINDEDDSDDSSINDVFENNNFSGEGSGSRIGIDSTSSSEVEEIDVVGTGFFQGPNGYRHYPTRANGYQHLGFGNNLTRIRGGRPRSSRANTLFHLHDIFGWAVGVNFIAENEDNSSDDYEMLWNLTERLGEVIPRGMDKREINRLPTRKFSQSRNNNYQSDSGGSSGTTITVKECQVCLSEFENNELLRILPCFHEFHAACIDRWLKNNNTCPVCRAEVNGLNSSE